MIISVHQYLSLSCYNSSQNKRVNIFCIYPPLNPTGPESLNPPYSYLPPQAHLKAPYIYLHLLTRNRTATHVHLLGRRAGRDVEVEDIYRKTERHACVGYLWRKAVNSPYFFLFLGGAAVERGNLGICNLRRRAQQHGPEPVHN